MTDQSLRAKLKELRVIIENVDNYGNDLDTYLRDTTIDAIIACFKDAGWRPPKPPVDEKKVVELFEKLGNHEKD